MQLSVMIGTIVAGLIACYLLDSYFLSRRDPTEPVGVRSRLPLVGNLLSVMDSPSEFAFRLDAKMPGRGSFMISIFGFKMYYVTERTLVLAIQRAAKTISFAPFSRRATVSLAKLTPQAADILNTTDASAELKDIMRHALLPGLDLDGLNEMAIRETARYVDALAAQTSSGGTTIDMVGWVKHSITLAVSDAWYGPKNPFRDPEHEGDYWTFKAAFTVLVGNILPGIFASKALKAQAALCRRYEEYHSSGGAKAASSIVRRRNTLFENHGFSSQDVARLSVAGDAALLGNLYPAAFWNIWNIIQRPGLLQELRVEVAKAVTRGSGTDGPTYTLDISALRTACPLLVSCFQETQRRHALAMQTREILQDTVLTPTGTSREVLFKQGSLLQISGLPALRSKEIWGTDAEEYDGHRFIRLRKEPDSQILKPSDLPSGAFPVWGIAPHVCPARQFASTACMAMAALLILRFDFEPARGDWSPGKLSSKMQSMDMPVKEVEVRVKRREDWNQGAWKVTIGQYSTRMPLAIT